METDKNQIMMGTAVLLTNGLLAAADAKTAHGLIRGTERFQVTGVIDGNHAGKDAGEVLEGIRRNIPVYAHMDAYLDEKGKKPDFAVIGVALCGGRLDEEWQAIAMDILNRGISIVNGMHMHLSEIPAFREAAQKNGAQIIDIRKSKPFDQLCFWSGRIFDMKIPRIAVLGTDCALGKRTTSRLILEACEPSGVRVRMIYTGQTGWLQGNPYGFILDSTLNDFVSGELEDAIVRCEQEAGPDLIIVEGQSALRNPLGPCGSEIILSGNIKGVILQHAPFRKYVDGGEKFKCLLPDLETEIRLVELYGSRVIAVTLNGQGGSCEELHRYGRDLEERINIPVILPLENSPAGMGRILPVVAKFIRNHKNFPDTSRRQPESGGSNA
ncbi:DUF1611 domain-containing protein [Desulfospira joergensenii]|uniref:DUF1611 domain-containing protein n=1 Tax=Desulfospira joergensenii TaxID=53329 RepID=UPI0003B4DCBF|nr:DUF1611 domain-containing protein [Desulfospira joergensenii]